MSLSLSLSSSLCPFILNETISSYYSVGSSNMNPLFVWYTLRIQMVFEMLQRPTHRSISKFNGYFSNAPRATKCKHTERTQEILSSFWNHSNWQRAEVYLQWKVTQLIRYKIEADWFASDRMIVHQDQVHGITIISFHSISFPWMVVIHWQKHHSIAAKIISISLC